MKRLLQAIWPHPERPSPAELAAFGAQDNALDAQIRDLKGLSTTDSALYLDAARRIADEEERRKAGAETRATTFIAAVAALIPLMTWALGSSAPFSEKCDGAGCFIWAVSLPLSVLYFVTAAYWALRTLEVANYLVIGVEDVVQFRQRNDDLHKALIQDTLLLARRNRDTINKKIMFIKVAQKRFFNGLALLGLLLALDPITRLGPTREDLGTTRELVHPTKLVPEDAHPSASPPRAKVRPKPAASAASGAAARPSKQ